MLALQPLGDGCFGFNLRLIPSRIPRESFLGFEWKGSKPPELREGEILIAEGDFRDVIFNTRDAKATFYGEITHTTLSYPSHVLLRSANVLPICPKNSPERLWVDLKFLPAVVKHRLGAARLDRFQREESFWFEPSRPLTHADVELIGYHKVSEKGTDAMACAVPVHEHSGRGLIFRVQHFRELQRFGVEGLKAEALTRQGLRLSKFKVIDPVAAAAVVPWLGQVAPSTTIEYDWPFKHPWRLGVAVAELGKLEGQLGDCIYDDGDLWICCDNLRLRAGSAPIALKNHPTIRTPWILTSPETREVCFIAEGRARRTHITRGMKRFQLVENGSLIAQKHLRRDRVAAAPAKNDIAERKVRLQAQYPRFELPEHWERHTDESLATHFEVERLVRDERWSWRPRECPVDYDAGTRFFAWMEREQGLSLTSPVSRKTCYRYASPGHALETHDPVELIRVMYPVGSAFIFRCACRADFAPKAMFAALVS